ncbi:Tail-specific protease precursor [Tsuneonella dongtanensis]|uniref:Tail-specific protease n=1 Tax=Tsuneonella dongtanensis TaxID=692370 RepID=A0A1B2A9M5_9SPHN|nr:S41 family peptidase [Tsuneonella dongtanensis]ANY18784.1 Tail-specific protease precursor [Tsuneonella dongtanensis]
MFDPSRLLMTTLALAVGPVALAAAVQPARAQGSATAVDSREVVDAARALVRDHYVIPETAAALDRALADAQAAGTFAGLSAQDLSEAINRTMKAVTPDGHLGASYNPARAADLAVQHAAGGSQDQGLTAAMQRMIALNNGGVSKLEVLPGNVRYMDYTGFMWGAPEAQAAITHAMEFMRQGSAVIIDLRRNGGGSAEAVADLASWFLPADTPLMQFQTREGPVETTKSSAKAFSLSDRPVYVLTSKRSFSAAEEFAAHVSAFGFGSLVGETTGGGGFNNTFYPLPGGHVISISTGQALQLKSGKGWERTGIAPAIAVPQDRALVRAQAEALTALAAKAEAGEKAALDRIAPVFRAQAEPVDPARALAAYVGDYGPMKVTLEGDHLVALTPTGPSELVELGGDLFAPVVQPTFRVQFVFEGETASAIELVTGNGTRRMPRS